MSNFDALETGYDAYWDGAELSDNPYDQEKESREHHSWIEGWREARRHDYDESEGRG